MTSELAFISALRTLATDPAARGLYDDCAVLGFGTETLVITHDAMAEGTHFSADADMADVAWKLVAVNLSDLAAKGAEPLGVLLGHSLGRDDMRFAEGLGEALAAFDVSLLGGDTVRAAGARMFGMTAIGRATHAPVPDRRNAQEGEAVWVTGTVRRAMLGFEMPDANSEFRQAYLRPRPRLAEGRALAPHVGAMMDVSDGLLLDCWRMAVASQVTIDLDSALIPVADRARADDCLRWGDDYELLFTLPDGMASPVAATRIGQVCARDIAAVWLDGQFLTPTDRLGYEH